MKKINIKDKIPHEYLEQQILGVINIDPQRNLPTWNAINTQLGQEQLIEDPTTTRKTHTLATLTGHMLTNTKVKYRMLKFFMHR